MKASGEPPSPRRGHSACRVGKEIWIFGGIFGHSKYFSDVIVLNVETMTWSRPELFGQAPSGRAWHSAVALGHEDTGVFLLYGGTAGRQSFFDDVYILDTRALLWTKIDLYSSTPPPRCSHSACMIGGNMVVFGGLTTIRGEDGRTASIQPLDDLWVLETGLDIPWCEEEEHELAVDSEVKLDLPAVQTTEVPSSSEVWVASQSGEEKAWIRRRALIDKKTLELTIMDMALKGQELVGDARVVVWRNRRSESELRDIPDPSDRNAMEDCLQSLLRSALTSELRKEFLEFCRTLYNFENILFLSRVDKFREDTLSSDGGSSNNNSNYSSALDIYRVHLKFGGNYETTASERVRRRVKRMLRDGANAGLATLFDEAYSEIFTSVTTTIMPKWAENEKMKAAGGESEESQFRVKLVLSEEDKKQMRCGFCEASFQAILGVRKLSAGKNIYSIEND